MNKTILYIGINEEVGDLAVQLALALAHRGQTVLVSRLTDEVPPGRVVDALHLASVRLAVMEIHGDDLTSSMAAARQAGLDYHIVLLDDLDPLMHAARPGSLIVNLTRTEDSLKELLTLVDLALQLKRGMLFVLLLEQAVPAAEPAPEV
ncbi:hypothetical protein MF271_08790 [Deinococcus sp. KNUC1210]|uniref:hypothetical protein n=1 Tax=Deinococcus sp. KNUC1210 TaxID=2917691 RepID=UPI001EF114D9|nr:hypothetical protein [Deinococcus sp. KNUC1210]ULH16651.1 hypothetical protein MF271_08790 [Deinococcus sp. KNUC1210]